MYESMTYEGILQRMLEKIPSNMDKREGSILYDAIAPAALELQLMYIELDVILTETFGDTASREYLIRRAVERGLAPMEATYALLKGEFNMEISIGARFSCGDLNYVVVEKIDDFSYQLRCESLGIAGNKNFGSLIPIDYINGLTTAQLSDLLIPGEDEEDTEEFRTRYLNSFNSKAYGGNVEDYLQKTNSIAGVGATRVTPVWNGGGTVLLTILDSEFNKASDTLLEKVQEEIDPTQDSMGVGVAPIGHIVTVDTVEEVVINIATTIVFQEGYSFLTQEEKIKETIDQYFLELKEIWATESATVIRISQIDARIMNLEGVIDIADTQVNECFSNLILEQYEIPILGVISSD